MVPLRKPETPCHCEPRRGAAIFLLKILGFSGNYGKKPQIESRFSRRFGPRNGKLFGSNPLFSAHNSPPQIPY